MSVLRSCNIKFKMYLTLFFWNWINAKYYLWFILSCPLIIYYPYYFNAEVIQPDPEISCSWFTFSYREGKNIYERGLGLF